MNVCVKINWDEAVRREVPKPMSDRERILGLHPDVPTAPKKKELPLPPREEPKPESKWQKKLDRAAGFIGTAVAYAAIFGILFLLGGPAGAFTFVGLLVAFSLFKRLS